MADVNRRTALGISAALAASAAVPTSATAAAAGDAASEATSADSPESNPSRLPRFRFGLEASEPEVYPGGLVRVQTIKHLPVAEQIGAATFRMKAGAIRELHWHNCAEWALILAGHMRTTIFHPDGAAETNDYGPGDVWYFPPGHGHMLQCVGPDEAHFVLAFDDGNFDEAATFSAPAFLSRVPRAVLAKSLGVVETDLAGLIEGRNYLGLGRIPANTPETFRKGPARRPANTNKYPFLSSEPTHQMPGVTEWRVTMHEFPISTRICATVLDLARGALRELHWHPHAAEWQFVIHGSVQIGAVGPGPHTPFGVEELATGDVGYVPSNFGHYVENKTSRSSRVLLVFNSGMYQAVGVSDWLANNPAQVVADTLHLPDAVVARLPRRDLFVSDGPTPGR